MSCFTILFHGKLDVRCLAELKIDRDTLPCVHPLLITGTGGSGTHSTAQALAAAGNMTEEEMESKRIAGEAGQVDALEFSSVSEVKAWIKLSPGP